MVKNILYLSYDGMTDPLGQSQVLPYIIGLTKKGYHFHLISFEKPDRFLAHKKDILKICDENNITWVPMLYTKRPPLFSTIWDVWRMKRKASELNKEYSFSMVHCRSYLSALIGLSMKRRFKTAFLFDMRGFWADERVDGNIWNLKNPIYRWVYNYFKRKEKIFFSTADHIISLTNEGKKEILSWNGFENLTNKISVIPCCVDIVKFDKKRVSAEMLKVKKLELGINDSQFIMGYVGSIGTWYMLEEMLSFYKRSSNSLTDPLFLFVTKENPKDIYKLSDDLEIPRNEIIVTSCNHADMPLYMSLFSCSIFFIKPLYSKKASSPTKQGELMAMGIPIMCNDKVGDTAGIVRKYNSGLVISSDKINESVMSDYTFSESKAIEGAQEYFGLEKGLNTYGEIYKKII
ncbi:MAG: glycosyltransferase [Flavobacteriales bacterium]|nr:glycosyltransferase [Flavobacteriales bacterium]